MQFPSASSYFFFKTVLAILGSLLFHLHFGMTLSSCKENLIASVTGNKMYRLNWKLLVNFITGRLPIHEHDLFLLWLLFFISSAFHPCTGRCLGNESPNPSHPPVPSWILSPPGSPWWQSWSSRLNLPHTPPLTSFNPSACTIFWTLSPLDPIEGTIFVHSVPLPRVQLCIPSGTHYIVGAL